MRRLACFALLLAGALALETTTSISPAPSPTNGTCPSASINVITNRLPQQCLRSNRTSSQSSVSAALSPNDASAGQASFDSDFGSTAAEPPRTQSSPPQESESSEISQDDSTSVTLASKTVTAPDAPDPAAGQEADSFLDAARFLSFEDWKKQKLGEAAAAAESAIHAKSQVQHQSRQRPGEGFDTLGEESEISLDFGFGGAPRADAAGSSISDSSQNEATTTGQIQSDESAPRTRNKDAGRTCKERFNYASFDCAASVLKTNPKCKSSTSVLVENKDSYMLNECSTENKFLIVELCEHVEIDTIVLANFEFFSSMFRTFRISASDRYPVKIDKWVTLGTFEARNTREIQAFLVENPMIWAKYLRVEFLSQYGNEFYCPLSLLRVHGTNMVEDFRRMTDTGEDIEESETALIPIVEPPAVRPPSSETVSDSVNISTVTAVPDESPSGALTEPDEAALMLQSCLLSPLQHQPDICRVSLPAKPAEQSTKTASTFAFKQDSSKHQAPATFKPIELSSSSSVAPRQTNSKETQATSPPISSSALSTSEGGPASPPFPPPISGNATGPSFVTSSTGLSPEADPSLMSTASKPLPQQTSLSSATAIAAPSSSQASKIPSPAKSVSPSQKDQSPSPQPAGQESIFKSITKRLALLEANATLSLQYIESQSALLRSAFSATNAQQLNKTAMFLEKLNATVLSELTRAKADYDQLWQSTVLELHDQREESRKEREVLGERVRMLAEEVVGTKRLMAAQATLLLVALGLFIFTRSAPLPEGSGGNSVDLRFLSNGVSGLMSHGRSRSTVKDGNPRSNSGLRNRWQWEVMSPWISPPQSRPGTSASADRHNTASERRSSDDSGPEILQNKPLPSRQVPESDDDHSDANSERRDTVTQHNYRPTLRLDSETHGSVNPYGVMSPVSPEEEDRLSPNDLAHHSLLRDVQSAPTTPSIATAAMSAESRGLAGLADGLATDENDPR